MAWLSSTHNTRETPMTDRTEIFRSMNRSTREALTIDSQFCSLLEMLAEQPSTKDRTGVGRRKLAGTSLQVEYVGQYAPVLLSKKVKFEGFIKEWCWMVRGETNVGTLGAKFWDAWADESGELGPIYGKQWRKWTDTKLMFTGDPDAEAQYKKLLDLGYSQRGMYEAGETGYYEIVFTKQYDQILDVEKDLRNRTCSSRNVVSAWNAGELSFMRLHPCHFAWQIVVSVATEEDKYLSGTSHDLTASIVVYQRSADVAVGVPFNLGFYALMLNALSAIHKYNVGSLTLNMGDCHVYDNQVELIAQQVAQWDKERSRKDWIPPKFELDVEGLTSIVQLAEQPERIRLVEYTTNQPHIPYPVSV